jgi:flagellar basal-body rod protein FlgC
MSFFDMMSISASALSAERQRAEITAANMANAETTHTDAGGPYVRKEAVFGTALGSPFHSVLSRAGHFATPPTGAVELTGVIDDKTPPVMRYEPGSPDADKNGYVAYPAINPITEMADLMGSTRAYQLNASAINAAKQMISESIDILKTT